MRDFPQHPELNALIREVHENVSGEHSPAHIGSQLEKLKKSSLLPEHNDHMVVLEDWIHGVSSKLIRKINQEAYASQDISELLSYRDMLSTLSYEKEHELSAPHRTASHTVEERISYLRFENDKK